MTYYNEHDPKAAAWLRELIKEGHLPGGYVDERSILDVRPHELTGYIQQHFFAGIGGWALALRLAGWADDRPVRSGSCPCQPFSTSGQGLAEKDERHLWPVFRDLITFGDDTITFGEQVASKLGRQWLARVRSNLEALGYGVGAADLCVAGVGAPHIRQRLWWMAYPASRRNGRGLSQSDQRAIQASHGRHSGGLGDSDRHRLEPGHGTTQGHGHGRTALPNGGPLGLGNADGVGCRQRGGQGANLSHESSFWSVFDIIPCRDGKLRRIEPGTFPLANGVPARVGRLRGYGNAINPQTAAIFIASCEEAIQEIETQNRKRK